jgi:hypothetical protein
MVSFGRTDEPGLDVEEDTTSGAPPASRLAEPTVEST